ncbi:hypothetical protein [Streptomyces virginiae]|uniref:hypothetical protein n=1 Tax=Streptomyces virginiae TaxID=1961 RepID=UPI0032467680
MRAEHQEQLRAGEEVTSLRQDLLTQENRTQAIRLLLEASAAEAASLRQERDRLRVESARLCEDLVGLQTELAAAEAGQEHTPRWPDVARPPDNRGGVVPSVSESSCS